MIPRKSAWPLVAAAAMSAAVHAVLIAGGALIIAPPPEPPVVLHARLAAPPPPPVAVAPEPAPRRAAPPLKPRARGARAQRVVAVPPAPGREPPPFAVAEEPLFPDDDGAATVDAAETVQTPPAGAPDIVALAPATTLVAPEPVLPSLPRRGRITYALFLGTDKFEIGRTVQTWEVEDGSYRIGSTSETTGLAAVLRSERRTYLSTGEVTPAGLRPKSFLMSRQRRSGTQVARASFDWSAGEIRWGTTDDEHEGPLPAGSQDFLSLMYHLSLSPPRQGRISVALTTGTKFETYELDVLPEEWIETPLGRLRALPVRQVRKPGAETIQIWLAAEYRHLPVMLRFYGRDGEPTGEQIVNALSLME